MDVSDLNNRFADHPPCHSLALALNNALPESREKSLAITHLEETMMWSNAAIARHQEG